ncbi:3',5'-cyclic adenosine monophosphate phosphodiesterase CpdA [Amylibacter ulvae]|uniref:3',5'-cyclic adenosine monophosphate phosphodiesterase CpdA n=1 Tax=Paramylibacter ulvae TaxID=1651968 RepID=A0ABQ3D266_9RHOB|nr:phosphodiesterase [Amylibacter ulvae]GHA52226.1 3',5'-cyclic adenosine monophosphate phosphodiesterase CpdA [Amylibacter ulvae]
MHKILVMTDIHLCEAGETIIGLDPLDQFQRALDHAAKTHPDAKALFLTGDLTHAGTPAQYQALKSAIDGYPIPITLLIGNHDEREPFLAAFPNAPQAPDGFIQSVQTIGDDVIITLDTVDRSLDSLMGHAGFLCPARLAWLEQQLINAGDARVLLFLHHPPHDIGFPGMDMIRIRNGDELLALLNRFPNVAHFFAGHVHRTISGTTQGQSFSMFKSTCHQMPMVTDVCDPSLSVEEPAAYGIIFVSNDSIVVHSEDYDIAVEAGAAKRDGASQVTADRV